MKKHLTSWQGHFRLREEFVQRHEDERKHSNIKNNTLLYAVSIPSILAMVFLLSVGAAISYILTLCQALCVKCFINIQS